MPIHSSATENPGYLKGRGERREEEEEEGEGVGGGEETKKKEGESQLSRPSEDTVQRAFVTKIHDGGLYTIGTARAQHSL